MPISVSNYIKDWGPWAPVYTYVTNSNRNIHIAVALLQRLCQDQNLEPKRLNLCREAFWSFVENNAVDLKRVWALRLVSEPDPIILCQDRDPDLEFQLSPDESAFLADGHHRYCASILAGRDSIPAYIVLPDMWRSCVLTGLPAITKAQLIAEPPRNPLQC